MDGIVSSAHTRDSPCVWEGRDDMVDNVLWTAIQNNDSLLHALEFIFAGVK